jgi:glycosyltransferase involved in cell wall biosynthesis
METLFFRDDRGGRSVETKLKDGDGLMQLNAGDDTPRKDGGLRAGKSKEISQSTAPMITVVTVVYNGEKYIEKTIKSVIDIGCNHLEFVIIDGGSTDGTVEVIRKYEDAITYWISEKDNGIYDAMNKGWALANEHSQVLFLGAGDELREVPSLRFIEANSDSIVYGDVDIETRIFRSTANWRLKLGNTLHHQALLVPKKIHIDPPFRLKYPIYADYDFSLRAYNSGVRFVRSRNFRAYALPDGVSATFEEKQMAEISRNNCGFLWGLASKIFCRYLHLRLQAKGR